MNILRRNSENDAGRSDFRADFFIVFRLLAKFIGPYFVKFLHFNDIF